MKNTSIIILLFSLLNVLPQGKGQQIHCSYPNLSNFNTELGSTNSIFDWTQEWYDEFYINFNGGVLNISAQSPFHFDNQDENINHLKLPIIKDHSPEDGWELLATNFGSPQPIGTNQLTGVSIPSFVLYNRYESKIRSFFYIPPGGVTEGTTFNKSQIILDFNGGFGQNKESALFSHLQSPLKALDDFQKNLTATSPNFYNNGGNYWLFADYPVAYDPCTCDHSTWFKIDPVLLNIQDISLEIIGGGTISPISVVSGSQPQSAPFSSVINNIENATSKGVKIAKSLEGFRTFIEGIVGASDLINDHAQYNDLDELEKAKYDLSARESFKFPSWTKDIPKFGIFLGIAEFLIGGGKSSGASSGPSSFEAKLKFNATGNITSPAPFEGIEMYTPGSIQGSDPDINLTPHYDNILGIFNILNTPIINYSNDVDINDGLHPNYLHTHFSRFQLENEIKYVINPTSGLSQTPMDIKVALVFHFREGVSINLNSSTAINKIIVDGGKPIYQTPFMPLACINDYIVQLYYLDSPRPNELLINVKLKIMVSLKRDELIDPFPDPNADDVLFIATYNTQRTVNQTIPSPGVESYMQDLLTLDNISFTMDQTFRAWNIILGENIETNGNDISIIAGNGITADLTNLPPNMTLSIERPNGCDGTPLAQTGQEVFNFCNSTEYDPVAPPPPSLTEPNPPNNFKNSVTSNKEIEVEVFPNPFNDDLNVKYKLSTDGLVSLTLQNSLGQIVNEKIITQQAGDQLEMIDGSELPNGMYYLTIKTTDSLKTIKASKQNRQ